MTKDDLLMESEIAKNEAERLKLELEAAEIRKRLNLKLYSGRLFLQTCIGAIVAAALIAAWVVGYFEPILKKEQTLTTIEDKVRKAEIEEKKLELDKLTRQNKELEQDIKEKGKILNAREKEIERLEQIVFIEQAEQVTLKLKKETPKTKAKQLLRSEPITLSSNEIFMMVGKNGFSLPGQNIKGYFKHQYERKLINDNEVIVDHATGLTWEQSGSPTAMTWEETNKYIDNLNSSKFAGYSDWRVPTIEELVSLVELDKNKDGLYIAPLFDSTQRWCGSSDKSDAYYFWGITLYEGKLYRHSPDFRYYYRAVRSN